MKRRALLASAITGILGVRAAHAAERVIGWISPDGPEASAQQNQFPALRGKLE